MITRLIVLCCSLIPLLCLAVAPQKNEKFSRIDLDFVPPQAMSQLGQVSVAGDQFVINAMSDRKSARLNVLTDPSENQRGLNAFGAESAVAKLDELEVRIAIEPGTAVHTAGFQAGGQEAYRPVLIILAVPPNVGGELRIAYGPSDQYSVATKAVAIPAAAYYPVAPK